MAAGPLTRRRGLQPFQCKVRRIPIRRTLVNKGRGRAGAAKISPSHH